MNDRQKESYNIEMILETIVKRKPITKKKTSTCIT